MDEYTAKWISVNDALPVKEGWYLVYAPTYEPGSSTGQKKVDGGYMFAKFSPKRDVQWSISTKWRNKGVVKFWTPLPPAPEVKL